MKRLNDAEKVYWGLIERNPDQIFYYKQIEKCQGIGIFKLIFVYFLEQNSANTNQLKIKNIYEKALTIRPSASIPQFLILFCLEGLFKFNYILKII